MHVCEICSKQFDTGPRLAGHRTVHLRSFEELKQPPARRNHLIAERGHQCEVCKLTHWLEQKIPLELDHIDGNPDNNEKSNFRLICPNCHAQTSTYRGRNRGKHPKTKRKEMMDKYPSYR